MKTEINNSANRVKSVRLGKTIEEISQHNDDLKTTPREFIKQHCETANSSRRIQFPISKNPFYKQNLNSYRSQLTRRTNICKTPSKLTNISLINSHKSNPYLELIPFIELRRKIKEEYITEYEQIGSNKDTNKRNEAQRYLNLINIECSKYEVDSSYENKHKIGRAHV